MREKEKSDDEIIPETEEAANIDGHETIKNLRKKLALCQAEKQEYLDISQRLKADYVNQKKSEANERSEAVKFARADLLLALIALADSFELAFSHQEAWRAVPENWRVGVEQIYSQLLAIFRDYDLEIINPQGKAFDPAEHHAFETVPVESEADDNLVQVVIQPGYRLYGKLLRPAKVKVGHFNK